MPCPEQAAAQPRLQDRVQSPKYRSRHTDSGECPPDRAPAGNSQYEFLNALIPGVYSFTVALADEEATRRLMVNIAATLSNRAREVVNHHALGNFKFEAGRSKAGFKQD